MMHSCFNVHTQTHAQTHIQTLGYTSGSVVVSYSSTQTVLEVNVQSKIGVILDFNYAYVRRLLCARLRKMYYSKYKPWAGQHNVTQCICQSIAFQHILVYSSFHVH